MSSKAAFSSIFVYGTAKKRSVTNDSVLFDTKNVTGRRGHNTIIRKRTLHLHGIYAPRTKIYPGDYRENEGFRQLLDFGLKRATGSPNRIRINVSTIFVHDISRYRFLSKLISRNLFNRRGYYREIKIYLRVYVTR